MEWRLEKLLQVTIFHNYYSTDISEDFNIEPTQLCAKLLRNYALIFRKTPTGFAIFYQVYQASDGSIHPLKPINNDIKFSFTLKTSSPYLLNYTDLPLDDNFNKIYYLNNLNNNEQNNNLLLTSNINSAYISSNDRLELKPQTFNYNFTSSNTSAGLKIIDELGNTIVNETLSSNNEKFNYDVNLKNYSPGKFKIKINGSEVLSFYADDELIGKAVFGIIDIFRNGSVPSNYRFTDNNFDAVLKTYAVKFNKRKTYWKYYVVLKYRSDITPSDLTIIYPDNSASFVRQAEHKLSDGLSAVPFVSNAQISLQKESVKGIQLKKVNGNNSGIFEVDNLPNASITSITPDSSENKIYSEIYIYV